MHYRIISSSYGDDILEHYPLLDRFNVEVVSDIKTYYYITIDAMEDLHELMNYVGCIIIDNYVVHADRHRWYYEPTIEIYDGCREGFIQND